MANGRNLRQVGDRVEALIEEFRTSADEPTRARAEELVGMLVDLYGAGLERIMEILSEEGDAGERVMSRLVDDRFVESLLVLHSLHPVDVDTRVQQALEQVRPYLGSHAGGVEYLGIDDEGVARLKLQGSCDGCPSSTVTVQLAIERAIQEAAPELAGIEVEGVVEPEPRQALLQIQPLHAAETGSQASDDRPGDGSQDGWSTIAGDAVPAPGSMRSVDVGGAALLLVDVDGSMLAYVDACGACGGTIRDGSLERERLTCTTCGSSFDVLRAGRGIDAPDVHLQPLPLLPRDGDGWSVATPAGVGA